MHLLLVEDDARLGRALTRLLGDDHHVVEWVRAGSDALDHAAFGDGLDAVILDLGLPDISGLEVARRLRAGGSEIAILVLTARDAVGDRVAGLDAGADDYLVKPFAYEELSARLRAIARRTGPRVRTTPMLRVGPIELDETSRSVSVDGAPIHLSAREFSLLECFLRHPGATLSRDQLLDAAWPMDAAVTPNTVEAYVHLLREKLGPARSGLIRTVRGVGYRLEDAA